MELDKYRKQEYATKLTLIGLFLSIFAGIASRIMLKQKQGNEQKLKPFDLALLSFSTYRLGRLAAFDKVFDPIRMFVTEVKVDETGAGKTVEPKGRGVQRSLGELISCPICAGTWIAAGLVYGLHLLPQPTRLFLWVNSSVGVAEMLNAMTEALSWFGQKARKEAGNGNNNYNQSESQKESKQMAEQITRSIIVKAPVSKVYQAWANFENFPIFMENIKSVRRIDSKTSHWEMEGPLGTTIEWEAETTRLDKNKRVGWSSKDHEESDITTSGQVTFNDLPHEETEITVILQYVPQKGGAAGEALAKMFSNPEKQLEQDLQNFKNYIEGRHERTPR